MPKKVVLCADDFGQNAAVSEGIIQLVGRNRLSAVSCLTTSTAWRDYAKHLLPYKEKIDLGLHFNLTENNATFSSLNTLLIKTYLHRIDQKIIENELHHQLDEFIAEVGCLPDFIDGHQHVHHLPIVRNALLSVYEKRLRHHHCYLRIASSDKFWNKIAFIKSNIITFTGALALKRLVLQKSIPHNQSFAGIYDFKYSIYYANYFAYFLNQVKDNGIIMCHPGLQSNDHHDLIAKSRWQEYQYLNSENFIVECSKQHVIISRFSDSP